MDKECIRHIFLLIWSLSISFAPVYAEETRPPMLLGNKELLHVSLSLIVVLFAIAFAAWLLRHFVKLGRPIGGILQILGGVSLGGRERVVLMQVGDRQILLGVAPGVVTTLYVLEENSIPDKNATNFSLALQSKLGTE